MTAMQSLPPERRLIEELLLLGHASAALTPDLVCLVALRQAPTL
jgi:hypothetical protein